jgi:malonate-semialdehyde dehydrogenase (acetylating)/methylmalonate-semialdehyde dehydrogenase
MIIMPDADMDQAADALIGAGYGAAGERCMAISVAVPVGEEDRRPLIEKLVPRVEALKIGPYTAGNDVDFGPLVTKMAKENGAGPGRQGVEQGAEAGRRRPRLLAAGLRERLLHRRHLFDNVTRTWTSTRRRSSARSCRSCARQDLRGGAAS